MFKQRYKDNAEKIKEAYTKDSEKTKKASNKAYAKNTACNAAYLCMFQLLSNLLGKSQWSFSRKCNLTITTTKSMETNSC